MVPQNKGKQAAQSDPMSVIPETPEKQAAQSASKMARSGDSDELAAQATSKLPGSGGANGTGSAPLTSLLDFSMPPDPEVLVKPPGTNVKDINLLRIDKTTIGPEEYHQVRLQSLPDHQDLQVRPATASPVDKRDPAELSQTLLNQGYAFMTTTAKDKLKMRATTSLRDMRRGSSGSTAPVEVRRGTVDDEYWVWRSSCHRSEPSKGTAEWDEFRHGLFGLSHSAMERLYTPNVEDANTVCSWEVGNVGAWTSVTLGGEP
jgi:hypothetical protein